MCSLCNMPRILYRPILFVGPTGTGKSAYVQEKMMNGLSKDRYLPTFVNFSAQTSANMTQVIMITMACSETCFV